MNKLHWQWNIFVVEIEGMWEKSLLFFLSRADGMRMITEIVKKEEGEIRGSLYITSRTEWLNCVCGLCSLSSHNTEFV